ncbi:hypothetical protein [Paraflavitalea pollutisoli]|uniref:hypothetical protein n=1 Tax=Paraflavitalea pollutisoli TaxID=3034143 RepID=UPI0023ECC610|nr:hypothetical protein [Paraflavitalea sp. H1-2-19X]
MNKNPDFWAVVIGPGPIGFFMGYLVIAYVSATISLLIDASNRNISSTATPVKFSWAFLLAANWKRILANFLAVPLLIRITYQYVGLDIMILAAIGVGMVIDRAAMWLKNIGILASQRSADRLNQRLAPDQPVVTDPKAN